MRYAAGGFGAASEIKAKEKMIKNLEDEINYAMDKNGLYEFYYKDGQIEEEGIYENGKKSSYSFFSRDGMLEETGNIKNYFFPNGYHIGYLDGPYERYHDNGQLMTSGQFKDGSFLAPYKVYYDDGSVYLDKNSQGEYQKFDRTERLIMEIVPTKCKKKEFVNRISNDNKEIEKTPYACFIKTSIESNGNTEKETISIKPFRTGSPNCLMPTHLCQYTSRNFIGNFYD